MADIQYGKGAYRRDRGGLPELRLVNMFLEATPSSDKGLTLQSRPGLETYLEVGVGPITGNFSQDGTFDGDVFSVSHGSLYRGADLLGAVQGPGPISFAASALEVLVTAGQDIYRYDGTDFESVSFPDGANVCSLAFNSGLFLACRKDTQKWYWSAVLDGSSWDGLDFASAESGPDDLFEVTTVGDELWFGGGETYEIWAPTGALDVPFSRVEARLYRKGVIASGCARELDNTLFWVGNDGLVYRGGAVPERVSDNGIEERIAASANVSGFGFTYEGHSFYCIILDAGTFALDVATKQWSQFDSYLLDRWLPSCACMVGDVPLFGHYDDGKLLRFGGWDDDGLTLQRLFSAVAPLNTPAIVDNLRIWANVGRTEVLEGQGSDPIVEMRSSDDAGATFGEWDPSSMGASGDYRRPAQFRRMGMFDFPGAVFEIRFTEPSDFRVSRVAANEPGGGRA